MSAIGIWRSFEDRARDWAPLSLRLIVGYGFVEHGYAKMARGPDAFATILQAIGVPAPHLMAWATEFVEVVGGLAILAGALVPIASVPMIIVLLTAIFTVHLPNGFSSIKLQSVTSSGAHFGQPGYETDLLYIAGLVTLVLGGSGKFSVDGFLTRALSARLNDRSEVDQAGQVSPSSSRHGSASGTGLA